MSSECEYEKYFDDYFFGDLSPAEDLALQKHLRTCKTCPDKLEEFYQIHALLKKYRRFPAAPGIRSTYHDEINLAFNSASQKQKIMLWINRYLKSRSMTARLVQVTLLVVIGVVLGWFVFAPTEPEIILHAGESFSMSRPISSIDLDYVNYYLLASEMVLLDIENSDAQSDFILNRELAQKLLIKTFRVHEIALQLNNVRLLKFLSRMELLLHEVSNLSDEEIGESIATIVKVIKEADLLSEVKDLQSIIKQQSDQFGT